jgi:hypothetical protein
MKRAKGVENPAGVSARRKRSDADDLPGLDALQRHEAFWIKRKQILNSLRPRSKDQYSNSCAIKILLLG